MAGWPKEYGTCQCAGQKHPLLANCLCCGLILCGKNGQLSACPYCGSAIKHDELANNNESQVLARLEEINLSTPSTNSHARWDEAMKLAHVNTTKLVQADSDGAKSTTVIDELFGSGYGLFGQDKRQSPNEIERELQDYRAQAQKSHDKHISNNDYQTEDERRLVDLSLFFTNNFYSSVQDID